MRYCCFYGLYGYHKKCPKWDGTTQTPAFWRQKWDEVAQNFLDERSKWDSTTQTPVFWCQKWDGATKRQKKSPFHGLGSTFDGGKDFGRSVGVVL